MARLPQPGGDSGNWGDILNDYLTQSHATDGTLKSDSVGSAQLQDNSVTAATIADGSITEAQLDGGVQTKLNAAPVIADGSIAKAKLTADVQTSLDKADAALTEASADAIYVPQAAQVAGDPTGQADGTPTTLSDGTPITLFGNSPITIGSGLYTHAPSAGTNKAGYIQADLGENVHRIGIEMVAQAGVTTGAIALVLPSAPWSDGVLPAAGVHAVFYPNGIWHISRWNAGETKYAQWDTIYGRFADTRDGKSHTIEIIIDEDRNALTIIGPDGRAVRASSPYISSETGTHAIWEIYNPDSTVYTSPKIRRIWAEGKRKGSATALASPEQLGKSLAATEPIEMVTTLPTIGQGQRGKMALLQGTTGVADRLAIVAKSEADTYSWTQFGRIIREYTTTQSGVTFPPNALGALVTIISAGGGGGSGRRGAAGSVRCGGGGGGSGGVISEQYVPASMFGANYTVTIGAPGTGGAAVAADDTNGAIGTIGANSSFATGSITLRTIGGGAGSGGTATTGAQGGAGAPIAASGANASATGGVGGTGTINTSGGAAGGGAGGGITSADSPSAGGPGGAAYLWGSNAGGAGGIVGGTLPGGGAAIAAGRPGDGSGGGAASITAAAQAGANAVGYGAGGSGGGASLNGFASGKGGDGGPAYVRVTFLLS